MWEQNNCLQVDATGIKEQTYSFDFQEYSDFSWPSFPLVPSESYKFSRPRGDNIHSENRKFATVSASSAVKRSLRNVLCQAPSIIF